MFWNKYFWPSFSVMIIIVGLHWFASLHDLYDAVWWYDIPMHFLGGLWVFLFILWVTHTGYDRFLLRRTPVRDVLILVLVTGILWEVLEIVLSFTRFSDPGYFFDMPKDLAMDTLGAVAGSVFYKK
ncbi:MAG: hypothetical protein AAB775_02110 [Patescibacteria group bacterium]